MGDQREEAEEELKSVTDLSEELCRLLPTGVVTVPSEVYGHSCKLRLTLEFLDDLPSSLSADYRRKAGDAVVSTGLIATLCEKASHGLKLKDKGGSDVRRVLDMLSDYTLYTAILLEHVRCLEDLLPVLLNLLKESYFQYMAGELNWASTFTLECSLWVLEGLARVPENRQHLRGLSNLHGVLKAYTRSENGCMFNLAITTMAYLATDSGGGVWAANTDMVDLVLDQLKTLMRDSIFTNYSKLLGVFEAVRILAKDHGKAELLVEGGVLHYLEKGLAEYLSGWYDCYVWSRCTIITGTLHSLALVEENREEIKDNKQLLDSVVSVYRNQSKHHSDCFEAAKGVLYRLRSLLVEDDDPQLRDLGQEVAASHDDEADDSSDGSEDDRDGQENDDDSHSASPEDEVDQSFLVVSSKTPHPRNVHQGFGSKDSDNATCTTVSDTVYQAGHIISFPPSVPRDVPQTSQPGSRPSEDSSNEPHWLNAGPTESTLQVGLFGQQQPVSIYNNAPQLPSQRYSSLTGNNLLNNEPQLTTTQQRYVSITGNNLPNNDPKLTPPQQRYPSLTGNNLVNNEPPLLIPQQQGPSATTSFPGPPVGLMNSLPCGGIRSNMQTGGMQHRSPSVNILGGGLTSTMQAGTFPNNPIRMPSVGTPNGMQAGNMNPGNTASHGTPQRMPDAILLEFLTGSTTSTGARGEPPGLQMPGGQMGGFRSHSLGPRPVLTSNGSNTGFQRSEIHQAVGDLGSLQATSGEQTAPHNHRIPTAVSDTSGRGAHINSSNSLDTSAASALNISTMADSFPSPSSIVPAPVNLPIIPGTSSGNTATASTRNSSITRLEQQPRVPPPNSLVTPPVSRTLTYYTTASLPIIPGARSGNTATASTRNSSIPRLEQQPLVTPPSSIVITPVNLSFNSETSNASATTASTINSHAADMALPTTSSVSATTASTINSNAADMALPTTSSASATTASTINSHAADMALPTTSSVFHTPNATPSSKAASTERNTVQERDVADESNKCSRPGPSLHTTSSQNASPSVRNAEATRSGSSINRVREEELGLSSSPVTDNAEDESDNRSDCDSPGGSVHGSSRSTSSSPSDSSSGTESSEDELSWSASPVTTRRMSRRSSRSPYRSPRDARVSPAPRYMFEPIPRYAGSIAEKKPLRDGASKTSMPSSSQHRSNSQGRSFLPVTTVSSGPPPVAGSAFSIDALSSASNTSSKIVIHVGALTVCYFPEGSQPRTTGSSYPCLDREQIAFNDESSARPGQSPGRANPFHVHSDEQRRTGFAGPARDFPLYQPSSQRNAAASSHVAGHRAASSGGSQGHSGLGLDTPQAGPSGHRQHRKRTRHLLEKGGRRSRRPSSRHGRRERYSLYPGRRERYSLCAECGLSYRPKNSTHTASGQRSRHAGCPACRKSSRSKWRREARRRRAKDDPCLECGLSQSGPAKRPSRHAQLKDSSAQCVLCSTCGRLTRSASSSHTSKSALKSATQSVRGGRSHDCGPSNGCATVLSKRSNTPLPEEPSSDLQGFAETSYPSSGTNTERRKTFQGEEGRQTNSRLAENAGTRQGADPHGKHSCPYCKEDFVSEAELLSHMKDQKHYKCSECDKCFAYTKTLAKHVKDKHDSEQAGSYPCGFCGKLFGSDRYRKDHAKIHAEGAGERYKCPHCDKRLLYRSSRSSHIKACKEKTVNAP